MPEEDFVNEHGAARPPTEEEIKRDMPGRPETPYETIERLSNRVKELEEALKMSDNVLRITHNVYRAEAYPKTNFDRQLNRARKLNEELGCSS